MKKFFQSFFRSYFGFTKRESRGFIFVFPTLVLLYFIPYGIELWLEKGRKKAYELYLEQAMEWKEAIREEESKILAKGSDSEENLHSNAGETMQQDTLKASVKPPISKPGSPSLTSLGFHETDSLVLQVVSGIGPVLAGRIVKYRHNLGGFIDPGQALEVYGVDEALAERMYKVFPFDAVPVQKLKLNSVSLQELAAHPYIKFGEAKVILAFRDQHGAFQNIEDLLKIKIFNEEWLSRLAPYLEP